jgi:filamentous hemagglutinin
LALNDLAITYSELNPSVPDGLDNESLNFFLNTTFHADDFRSLARAADQYLAFIEHVENPGKLLELSTNLLVAAGNASNIQGDAVHDAEFVKQLIGLARDYALLNPEPSSDETSPTFFLNTLWNTSWYPSVQQDADTGLNQFFDGIQDLIKFLKSVRRLLRAVQQIPALQDKMHDSAFVQDLLEMGRSYALLNPAQNDSNGSESDLIDDSLGNPSNSSLDGSTDNDDVLNESQFSFLNTLWQSTSEETFDQGVKQLTAFVKDVDNPEKLIQLTGNLLGAANQAAQQSPTLQDQIKTADFLTELTGLGKVYAVIDPSTTDTEDDPQFFLNTLWQSDDVLEKATQEFLDFLKDVNEPIKIVQFTGDLLSTAYKTGKETPELKKQVQNAELLTQLIDLGKVYVGLKPDTSLDLENDDPKFFLNTLWKTKNLQKGANELSQYLAGFRNTDDPTSGSSEVYTAIYTVEIPKDNSGQPFNAIFLNPVLPSLSSWGQFAVSDMNLPIPCSGTTPVEVSVYRQREDGSILTTDGLPVPYSQVIVKHSDGRENSLNDSSTPGYPSISLQAGDTIIVPTAELPLSAQVNKTDYLSKLTTAIDLAASEDAPPEIRAMVDAIKEHPSDLLAAMALLLGIQATPIGVIADVTFAIAFGTQAAVSFVKFLSLVNEAQGTTDEAKLREAARAFNSFSIDLVATVTFAGAGLSKAPLLGEYLSFIRAIPEESNANLLVQVSGLLRRLFTNLEKNATPFQAALEEAEAVSPSVAQFMQQYGDNAAVVAYLSEVEATNNVAEFTRLVQVAQQLAKPEYADVASAVSQFPDSLGAILEYGTDAFEVLSQRGSLLMRDNLERWTERLAQVSPQEGAEILEGTKYALKIRTQLGIGRRGNVGFADFKVKLPNGETIKDSRNHFVGVSGRNSLEGTLPIPPDEQRIFQPTPLEPPLTRTTDADSEVEILEAIASELQSQVSSENYSAVEGQIILYIERAPCDSCERIINEQWKKLFPKIQIRVIHGPRYLPDNPSFLQ